MAGMDGVLAQFKNYTRGECCAACVSNSNCAAATSSAAVAVASAATAAGVCTLRTNGSATVGSGRTTATAVVRDVAQMHQGGRYGRWEHDSDQLPVYCYELDQVHDAADAAGLGYAC